MGYAVIGLLVLISGVLGYFSYKSAGIIRAVLSVFVFYAACTFLVLLALTVKTHQQWITAAQKQEAMVNQLEKDIQTLSVGNESLEGATELGIEQLKNEIDILTLDRGRVWFNARPTKSKGGVVTLEVGEAPHGLKPQTLVFAFEDLPAAEGGRFLGEFTVTAASDKATTATISPNMALDKDETDRIDAKRGTWSLYAIMPIDRTDLFAKLTDAEKSALFSRDFPKEAVTEYGDAKRKLHSYEHAFRNHYLHRKLVRDEAERLTAAIARTDADLTELERESGVRTTEKQALEGDKRHFLAELKVIKEYEKQLSARMASLRNDVRAQYAANKQAVAELTRSELEAANKINQRFEAASASAAVDPPRPGMRP